MVVWYVKLIYDIIVALIVYTVVYLLTPKPDGPSNAGIGDLENPTASAGRPIPVLFGTMTIKSANILWHGNKTRRTYEKSTGGGKK